MKLYTKYIYLDICMFFINDMALQINHPYWFAIKNEIDRYLGTCEKGQAVYHEQSGIGSQWMMMLPKDSQELT